MSSIVFLLLCHFVSILKTGPTPATPPFSMTSELSQASTNPCMHQEDGSYEESIMLAFNKLNKKNKIDSLVLDSGNGDGVFKARGRKDSKWGMYQYYDQKNIQELIPMQYDSLEFFPWNGNYTAVYLNGKVGVYLCYWTYGDDACESVPCEYDNYQRFKKEDGTPILAFQKGKYWGWVDWLSGKPKSEFQYESLDALPYPYYTQHLWKTEE
jgi:hypothetical protein